MQLWHACNACRGKGGHRIARSLAMATEKAVVHYIFAPGEYLKAAKRSPPSDCSEYFDKVERLAKVPFGEWKLACAEAPTILVQEAAKGSFLPWVDIRWRTVNFSRGYTTLDAAALCHELYPEVGFPPEIAAQLGECTPSISLRAMLLQHERAARHQLAASTLSELAVGMLDLSPVLLPGDRVELEGEKYVLGGSSASDSTVELLKTSWRLREDKSKHVERDTIKNRSSTICDHNGAQPHPTVVREMRRIFRVPVVLITFSKGDGEEQQHCTVPVLFRAPQDASEQITRKHFKVDGEALRDVKKTYEESVADLSCCTIL